MNDILGKAMPIILLILLGVILRRKNAISEKGMQGVKYFVVNISLACVLFNLFVNMQISAAYISIFAVAFAYFLLTFFAGFSINKIPLLYSKYTPFIACGASVSLVGLGIFSIMFGEENLAVYSVIGLAHEIFIWIIYYSTLRIKIGGKKISLKEIFKVLTSPILLSIFAGILCNLLKINTIFASNFIWISLSSTVIMLAQTATPIILVVVGYGITIDKNYLKQSLKLLASRYIITIVCGAVLMAVVNAFLNPSPITSVTFFSLLLLPSLSSIPILIGALGDNEGQKITSNAVALSTLIGIILFISYSIYIVGTVVI